MATKIEPFSLAACSRYYFSHRWLRISKVGSIERHFFLGGIHLCFILFFKRYRSSSPCRRSPSSSAARRASRTCEHRYESERTGFDVHARNSLSADSTESIAAAYGNRNCSISSHAKRNHSIHRPEKVSRWTFFARTPSVLASMSELKVSPRRTALIYRAVT